MKKLVIFLMVTTLSLGAFCQDSPMEKSKDTSMGKMHHRMMRDCVVMRDGKAKVWKGGNASDVSDSVTLNNGATVTSDGTIKMVDGTTKMLREGDYIDMDGKIGTVRDRMKKKGM